jgi:hypothetical protein
LVQTLALSNRQQTPSFFIGYGSFSMNLLNLIDHCRKNVVGRFLKPKQIL